MCNTAGKGKLPKQSLVSLEETCSAYIPHFIQPAIGITLCLRERREGGEKKKKSATLSFRALDFKSIKFTFNAE